MLDINYDQFRHDYTSHTWPFANRNKIHHLTTDDFVVYTCVRTFWRTESLSAPLYSESNTIKHPNASKHIGLLLLPDTPSVPLSVSSLCANHQICTLVYVFSATIKKKKKTHTTKLKVQTLVDVSLLFLRLSKQWGFGRNDPLPQTS